MENLKIVLNNIPLSISKFLLLNVYFTKHSNLSKILYLQNVMVCNKIFEFKNLCDSINSERIFMNYIDEINRLKKEKTQ